MKMQNSWRIMSGVLLLAVAIGMLMSTGCAKFDTYRGVEPLWRADDLPKFTSGKSTQQDVMKALGPPSQVISLNKGSIFYYLQEHGKGGALILIIYNQVEYNVTYDRSIFFFNDDGILTEFSFSHLPLTKEEKKNEKAAKKSK